MKNLTQMSEFERRMNSCPHPTRFLRFYVNFLLVAGLVLDAFSLIGRIYDPSVTGLENIPALYYFYIGYCLCLLAVRFITYLHLKKCKKTGYVFNYIFIILFILYAVLFVNLTVATIYLIYGVCVMVYFHKRKALFDPSYLSTPAVISLEDESEHKDPPPPQSSVPDTTSLSDPALDTEPSVNDILSEMGKIEPSAPVPSSSAGIDLSGLTDEQKALVAQLVDSMKK